MKTFIGALLASLLFWTTLPHARGAVILSLADASNINNSTMTLSAGVTFTVSAYVTGLSASQPLDSFDIQLAVPPGGFTLNAITTPLANWQIGPNPGAYYSYGLANSISNDFYGNAVLLNFNFNTAIDIAPGSYTLNFSGNAAFNDLFDFNGTAISYSTAGMTVNVVPEPHALLLLGLGAFFLLAQCLARHPASAIGSLS